VQSPEELTLVPWTRLSLVCTPGFHIAEPHMSRAHHTNPPLLTHMSMLRSDHVNSWPEKPLRHMTRSKVSTRQLLHVVTMVGGCRRLKSELYSENYKIHHCGARGLYCCGSGLYCAFVLICPL
jgi:hypothetical protein